MRGDCAVHQCADRESKFFLIRFIQMHECLLTTKPDTEFMSG